MGKTCPTVWTDEFKALLRTWSQLTYIAELDAPRRNCTPANLSLRLTSSSWMRPLPVSRSCRHAGRHRRERGD